MRWPHPERGMISPSEFIPLAEDCGLIGPVTTQALEAAMRECCAWRKEGIEIPFAVNVSARSLGDGRLVDEIRALLTTWKLPGEALQLELTESLLLDEPAVAQEVLRPLREMGVSLAIDDFGTGWSSLGKLSELPFDELKIDRSFVMRMQPGLPEDAIVRSTDPARPRPRPARRRRGRRDRGRARAPGRRRLRRRPGLPARQARAGRAPRAQRVLRRAARSASPRSFAPPPSVSVQRAGRQHEAARLLL